MKRFHNILLIAVPVAIILYLLISILAEPHNLKARAETPPEIIGNWYAHIDGSQYGTITVPSMFSYGKNTSLYYTLDEIDDNTYISLCTQNQRVRVSVAHQPVYEFGFLNEHFNQIPLITCEHTIQLKPEYSKEVISIELYPTAFPPGRMTRPITIGTLEQIQMYSIGQYRLSDTIGYLIFFIGIIALILFLLQVGSQQENRFALLGGVIFMLIGVKMFTQACLSTSIITDPYISFYLFWVSTLCLPVVIYLAFSDIAADSLKKPFRNACIASSLFLTVSLILTLVNMDICSYLMMAYYALNLIILSAITILGIRNGWKQNLRYILILPLFIVDVWNHYQMLYLPNLFSFDTIWLIYCAFFITGSYITRFFKNLYAKQYEATAMQMKISSLSESVNRMEEYNETLNKIRHDTKKHLMAIDALIEQGAVTEASSYTKKLIGDSTLNPNIQITENHITNAIMLYNVSRCKEADIDFTYRIALDNDIEIEDPDICAIYANCLDNAYEACLAIEKDRFIRLDSSVRNNYLYLRIENSAGQKAKKKRGSEHGWGIRIVRGIVAKYDGMMNIYPTENGVFVIEIALKVSH